MPVYVEFIYDQKARPQLHLVTYGDSFKSLREN